MRVEWLPAALQNLRDIVDHIGRENPAAARDVAEAVLDRVAQLSLHPRLGRIGRVEGTRELVISNTPFLVPYLIDDQVVTVLRVLHGRQQWPPGREDARAPAKPHLLTR